MSIRTNRMKAVSSLQKRLTTVKSKEKDTAIAEKLGNLMSELNNIKDLFSIVRSNEDELLDTLKLTDDLLRNFNNREKIMEISDRILQKNDAKEVNGEKGQDVKDEKSVEEDVAIEEKLERLKSELDNMKTMFSTLKKDKEVHEKLRAVEDFLRNFNPKPTDEANQTETEGLPSQKSMEESTDEALKATDSCQEAQDKKTVEKDIQIDEKIESLKSKLDKTKVMFSNVKKNQKNHEKFRAMEDLLIKLNAESSAEIVKPKEDSNESETKGLEQPSQGSTKELQDQTSMVEKVDQDIKTIVDDKPSSSLETQDKGTIANETKDFEQPSQGSREELPSQTNELVDQDLKGDDKPSSTPETQAKRTIANETKGFEQPRQGSREELPSQTNELVDQDFKGDDKVSSRQDAQEKKIVEDDLPIDEELERLKSQLDNIKTKFSTVNKNKEFHNTLKVLEDLLQNFNPESSVGVDKPSSSQEAQDKKGVEEDVLVDERLERLKSEIDNMKAKLSTLKKNYDLSNMLRALEDLIQNINTKSLAKKFKRAASMEDLVDQVMKSISNKIKESIKKLGVSPTNGSKTKGEASKKVQHPTLSLSQEEDEVKLILKRFQAGYDALNPHSKVCCLSLSVFPEDVVIKKRHIIYWWIGEGFVRKTTEKTAEDQGDDVFDELLNSNLIVPHGNGKSPLVKKFKIIPWIRHMLVSSVQGESKEPFGIYSQIITPSHHHSDAHACLVLDDRKVKISGEFDTKFDNWRSVFNLSANYVNIEPEWMAKMKRLVVLQLGRWQESPKHHIEVDSDEFMKNLKAQKHLKYLSFRGISRISKLPPSIAQLVSLQILDLKACHNLETLPNEIVLLRELTHLDVSECYLLENMPKGIEKLTQLQVLKGFVVGNSNKTPRISDLAKMDNLKRLSIHIGSEAVIQKGEFENLNSMKVKCLKISWGVLSKKGEDKDFSISLPSNLEKLDLEGFPNQKTPEWLEPMNLPQTLKKLYITGGKLTSIGSEFNCHSNVQIVRLKYLNNMKINPQDLKEMFPSLKYAEVSKRSFEWVSEEGESTSVS